MTSDRPPSILSEHGEGYCRVCRFIIGLGPDGLILKHVRGAMLASPVNCKGADRRPPKVTPFSSRKSEFRQIAPDAWCPTCKQWTKTTRNAGEQVYVRHSYPRVSAASVPVLCPRSLRILVALLPVTEPVTLQRQHSGERGTA